MIQKENIEYDNLENCVKEVYKIAYEYANEGIKKGIGGPFGAGIIQKTENGKYLILAIGRNSVIETNDPTAHAEINAIRKACNILQNKSLNNCILVTTAKSCPMCLSAAIWANIPVIYYSESYDQASNSGFRDNDIHEYLIGNNPSIITEKQLQDEKCKKLFESWNNKRNKIIY